jgi:MFS family permease
MPLLAISVLGASNFEVGLVTAAGYAAIVLIGLPAGVIVQRFALRELQVSMDGARLLLILSVPVAAWLGVLTMAHVLVVAFLVGLASNFFAVANGTYIPQVVPRAELTKRNGLLSGTFATTQFVGLTVGGVLVGIAGAASALVVDAVSYGVSGLLISRIPAAGAPERTTDRSSFGRQLADALVYIFRHPVMRPGMLAATAVNTANGALLAVTAPFLVRQLDLPVGLVGLVIAVDGIGAVIGAAVVTPLVNAVGNVRALLLGTTATPLLGILMPLAVGPAAAVIFMVGMAGMAAGITVLSVVIRTHRQTETPPELLARVVASVRFVSWGAIPIGALIGGTIAQYASPRAALVFVVAASSVAPILIWTSRARGVRRLEDVPLT